MTLFAGTLAERYGARRVTGFSLIFSMVLSLLAPISADVLWLFLSLQLFIGIGIVCVNLVVDTSKNVEMEVFL